MAEKDEPNPVVMVVEDFEATRLLIRRFLEMKGCRVVEAADGRQAVERAQLEHPQLILMDLNMPVLEGFTAALSIHKNNETRDVPIVAVTSCDTAESRAAARAVGCSDYLAKPIDFDRLLGLLRRYLVSEPPPRDAPLPA